MSNSRRPSTISSGSVPASASSEGPLKGWLEKRGEVGLVKGLKRRWFQQTGAKINYFKEITDKEPLGSIDISNFTVDIQPRNGPGFPFNIATPSRIYHLVAESEETMIYWVAGLKRYKEQQYKNLSSNDLSKLVDTELLRQKEEQLKKEKEEQLRKEKELQRKEEQLKQEEEIIKRRSSTQLRMSEQHIVDLVVESMTKEQQSQQTDTEKLIAVQLDNEFLKGEKSHLEKELAKLRVELTKTKEAAGKDQQEVKKLSEERASLQAKIDVLSEKNTESANIITALEVELKAKIEENKQLELTNASLQSTIQQSQHHSETAKQLQDALEEAEIAKKLASTLQEQLISENHKANELTAELAAKNNKMTSQVEKLEKVTFEQSRILKDQTEAHEIELYSLQTELSKSLEMCAVLKDDLDKTQLELNMMKIAHKKALEQVQTLSTQLSMSNDEITNLKLSQQSSHSIDDAEKEDSQPSTSMAEVDALLTQSLKQQLEATQQDLFAANIKLESIQEENVQLKEQLLKLEKSASMEEDAVALQNNVQQIELDLLKQEVQSLHEQLLQSEQEISTLRQAAPTTPSTTSPSQQETIEALECRVKQLQFLLDHKEQIIQDDNEIHQQQLETVSKELMIAQDQIAEQSRVLQQNSTRSFTVKGITQVQFETMMSELEKYREMNLALQAHIGMLSTDLTRLEIEKKVRVKTLERLRNQLVEALNTNAKDSTSAQLLQVKNEFDVLKFKYFSALVVGVKLQGVNLGWFSNMDMSTLFDKVQNEKIPPENWPDWITDEIKKSAQY